MTQTIPHPQSTDPDSESGTSNTSTNIQQFKLNHPKNYLAVPLAEVAEEDTEFLIREYAVNLPKRARRGAEETNLITPAGDLTSLGEATIVAACRIHGSAQEALEAFGTLHGSPKRFIKAFPDWQRIATRIAFQYDTTSQLVTFLREQGPLHLYELTWLLWKYDPLIAESVFLHPGMTDSYRIAEETRPSSTHLTDPSMYRSECTFQYKAFLYHCGILSTRGDYTSRLNPTKDTWALSTKFTEN